MYTNVLETNNEISKANDILKTLQVKLRKIQKQKPKQKNTFNSPPSPSLPFLQITKPVIFPYSMVEESEAVRVYYGDNSYRSLKITSSMTARDVCVLSQQTRVCGREGRGERGKGEIYICFFFTFAFYCIDSFIFKLGGKRV